MNGISLDKLLRQFEVIDANLLKIEKNFKRLAALEKSNTSTGYSFDDCSRAIYDIWAALPKIDSWKPDIVIYSFDDRTLMRFDASEMGEPHAIFATENEIERAEQIVNEYSYRARKKRLALTRQRILELVATVDEVVRTLKFKLEQDESEFSEEFNLLDSSIKQIDFLLGSAFPRPARWSDLRRHLSFWHLGDIVDIVEFDWPSVYPVLTEQLYTEDEPIELEIDDIGALSVQSDKRTVTTKLDWGALDADGFERLMFNLITNETGYRNPQWLMRTNAPDKGRDLSVERVFEDTLTGVIQQRVIIQCKHWKSRSVALDDVASLNLQVRLWEPPTIDVVVIATSGRFTADAVASVEKHNQTGNVPRIEMWPESHLEMLLARRPALLATFRLK